ncbi:MAG: hypothetical protein DRO40_08920 [Thermoprotei archaeon]|nr:MAG: hypothetical protein DRO40_08920 [Thermoprotei archaeon]
MLSIIVGLGIAIGIILYMLNLSQASSSAVEQIVTTVTQLMGDTFKLVVLLAPLIIVLAPVYILREKKTRDIVLGFVYGIILLILLNQMGLISAIYVYYGLTNAYWIKAMAIGEIADYLGISSFFLTLINTGFLFYEIDKRVWKKALRIER